MQTQKEELALVLVSWESFRCPARGQALLLCLGPKIQQDSLATTHDSERRAELG
jgi:hypothetical protein